MGPKYANFLCHNIGFILFFSIKKQMLLLLYVIFLGSILN